MKELKVNIPQHAYTITIDRGALKNSGAWLEKIFTPRKLMIVTDDIVDSLYSKTLINALEGHGFELFKTVIPNGERSKSLAEAEKLYDALADAEFTRTDSVVALGGGVVGDLAAFAASTFMRGISFVQIPTTLLAQVDSSIGGKTAVNTTRAKNLVGTFAQPCGVLIDPKVLQTLEMRHVREGIAEIVKCAAIADASLWRELAELKGEEDLLAHCESVILACLEVKRKVVEEDVFDNGQRLILNFGHTIGHAIENTFGYGVITHGEGVALGMVQLTRIAEEKGLTPAGTTEKIIQMLEKFHLPSKLPEWPEEQLYHALTHDKKARGRMIKIITLKKIGEAEITVIPVEEMRDYLKEEAIQ